MTTTLRIGASLWETGAPSVIPLRHARRSVVGLWARTVSVLALTGALGATATVSTPKAEQAKEAVAAVAVESALPKDETRMTPATPPAPAEPEVAQPRRADPMSPVALFSGEASAALAGFSPLAAPVAPENRFAPWSPPPAAPAPVEQEFPLVTVVDGRTLQAGAIRIRLEGLDLPLPEQVCRTLDGRFEPCVARAATQLELLTRFRQVACRYRMEAPGEAVGTCRVGAFDLAERMVRTGYVWRSAAAH